MNFINGQVFNLVDTISERNKTLYNFDNGVTVAFWKKEGEDFNFVEIGFSFEKDPNVLLNRGVSHIVDTITTIDFCISDYYKNIMVQVFSYMPTSHEVGGVGLYLSYTLSDSDNPDKDAQRDLVYTQYLMAKGAEKMDDFKYHIPYSALVS